MSLKVGEPSIAAAHEGQKVGGPRPARPNSFRRLCGLVVSMMVVVAVVVGGGWWWVVLVVLTGGGGGG